MSKRKNPLEILEEARKEAKKQPDDPVMDNFIARAGTENADITLNDEEIDELAANTMPTKKQMSQTIEKLLKTEKEVVIDGWSLLSEIPANKKVVVSLQMPAVIREALKLITSETSEKMGPLIVRLLEEEVSRYIIKNNKKI